MTLAYYSDIEYNRLRLLNMSDEEKDALRATRLAWSRTPRGRYSTHKSGAKVRGIGFEFTFKEWWSMWEPHFDQRGNGDDKLCMARKGDTGPYSIGNVRIITNKANRLEYINRESA